MKTTISLFIILALTTHTYGQKVYYVQDKAYNTNASDMNPGTDINLPWATWQKAFVTASAGDTVFFRGGIWYPNAQFPASWASVDMNPSVGRGKKGTFNAPIVFTNYPNEVPVLDCSKITPNGIGNIGISIANTTYLKLKGLTVRNVWQIKPYIPNVQPQIYVNAIDVSNCGVIDFENMKIHNNGGAGLFCMGFDTLRILNCDSYFNCDTLSSSPGNHGDGFWLMDGGGDGHYHRYTSVVGCRAWHNSDDGFDLSSNKTINFVNNWSWDGGWVGNNLIGEGNGYKFAFQYLHFSNARRVFNCISAYNYYSGFLETNLHSNGQFGQYYNNISYHDGIGFTTSSGNYNPCTNGSGSVVYRNNITFTPTDEFSGQAAFRACNYLFPSYVIQDHNSWLQTTDFFRTVVNPTYNITIDDFVNLDTAQLRWPRKHDGSLPDITFMRLKETSDLVDGGVDVGLPFKGTAPDLGAFELETVPGTSNKYPLVSIATPSNKSVLTNYSAVLTAKASDPDGTVNKVEFFYDDFIKIGEVSSTPWTFTWNNAPLGNHTIRAVATDNLGAKATSASVNVTVTPGGIKSTDEYILFPNPNDGSFTLFLQSPLKRNSSISVISTDGKTICTDTMAAEESIKQFNLPFLKPGIYLFMLASSEVYFTKMFVKQ